MLICMLGPPAASAAAKPIAAEPIAAEPVTTVVGGWGGAGTLEESVVANSNSIVFLRLIRWKWRVRPPPLCTLLRIPVRTGGYTIQARHEGGVWGVVSSVPGTHNAPIPFQFIIQGSSDIVGLRQQK